MDFTKDPAQATPPTPNSFELSLFGPGIGESIVAHIGDGKWIVVDSCLNPATGNAVALDYLACVGVDVGADVLFVVVSHWHDDHIRGISKVLEAAKSAKLVVSAAVQHKEFHELVRYACRHVSSTHTGGLDEMRYCLDELTARRDSPVFAGPQRILYATSSAGLDVEVRSLSPSDLALMRSTVAFERLLPAVGSPATRSIPNPKPNESAVVISVQCGPWGGILGSDLEETGNVGLGWSRVVATGTSPEKDILKVPHHGSPNGEHPGIWDSLLSSNPIAVLTPYLRGRRPLPAAADVTRLRKRTGRLFATRPTPPAKSPKAKTSFDKTKDEATKLRRVITRTMGHVRVRFPTRIPEDTTIELFGAALAL